jgi:hypothetical protein
MWLIAFLVWPMSSHSQSPDADITCQHGNGEYKAEFSTGVSVEVGPMRTGAFAERVCSAKLVAKEQVTSVVDDADRLTIDVLGADLGFGKPVVAFQIDQTGSGNSVEYQIYSLTRPSRLLYTLTGGDTYSAADADLDGHVEVWTDDATAVDGFEGVPKSEFDLLPTVVLRFEKGHLLDAGPEFVSYYDAQISKLRAQLKESDLEEFKHSDGRLSLKTLGSEQELHRDIRTKIGVLEVVWSYLYSGREKEAWAALKELWPSGDLDRIQNAIADLHNRGILRGVARSRRVPYRKSHAHIYDTVENSSVVSTADPYGGAPDPSSAEPRVIQPKSILLHRPPTSTEGSFTAGNETVELVVDAAGKVRSAQVIKAADDPLVQATSGWHFIPATLDGQAVACRFRLAVWTLK